MNKQEDQADRKRQLARQIKPMLPGILTRLDLQRQIRNALQQAQQQGRLPAILGRPKPRRG